MDLNAVARFVFEKNELLLGIFIVLFLLTTVLLLVLSVMKDKGAEREAASAGGVAIDPRSLNTAIEGALKKALSDRVVAGAVATVAGGAEVGGSALTAQSDAELQAALLDRESKIVALMADLDALKAHVDTHTAGGGGGTGGGSGHASGADLAELNELKSRIKELQVKLAEYEIIEDDIADLSLFKDENKKLKVELERLRAVTQTAHSQVQSVHQAVQESVAATPRKSEQADKFKLDPADDVMNEFAQALAVQAGEPVTEPVKVAAPVAVAAVPSSAVSPESALVVSQAGAPVLDPQAAIDALLNQVDTDKMISEAESLSAAGDSSSTESSVLDDGLDTDKLMAEMGMGVEVDTAETSSAATALDNVEASLDVPTLAAPVAASAEDPVDDLLAEFKDTDFLPSKADGKKGE